MRVFPCKPNNLRSYDRNRLYLDLAWIELIWIFGTKLVRETEKIGRFVSSNKFDFSTVQ